MNVTKARFKKLYKQTTLQEMADKLKVSIGTIKNYAKVLGLSKGKGNRVNHKRLFSF